MIWKRWSTVLVLLSVLVFSAAPALAAEPSRSPFGGAWSVGEATLLSGFMLLNMVDLYQTAQFERLGLHEANPLVGDPPNMGIAAGLKLGVMASTFLATHFLVPRGVPRLIVLGITTSLLLSVVVWNEAASRGIIFRF